MSSHDRSAPAFLIVWVPKKEEESHNDRGEVGGLLVHARLPGPHAQKPRPAHASPSQEIDRAIPTIEEDEASEDVGAERSGTEQATAVLPALPDDSHRTQEQRRAERGVVHQAEYRRL